MAQTALGKRRRTSTRDDADESCLKRLRPSTRSFVVTNDENRDPENTSFEEALASDSDVSAAKRKTRKNGILSPSVSALSSPVKGAAAAAAAAKGAQDAEAEAEAAAAAPLPRKVPVTPSTARFRHHNAAGTPTRTPPVTPTSATPRFRVMSVGKMSRRMTPRSSSAAGSPSASNARSPGTSTHGGAAATPGCHTVYHQARQLFSRSSSAGTALVGRDAERQRLHSFVQERCCTSSATSAVASGGCLYVSGPPGTGKSAMVTQVADQISAGLPSLRKAYINCMSIRSSNDLYDTLLRMLLLGDGAGHEDGSGAVDAATAPDSDAVQALQALFVPKQRGGRGRKTTQTATATVTATSNVSDAPVPTTYLVVLDEIDHIVTLDLDSLYRVIEWSMLKGSRLVLVGIANALDLTDRFLPRLKARNLNPDLLPFLPYTAPQIKHIVTTRLKSVLPAQAAPASASAPASAPASALPFFHPAAIELCARKVASQTGDLRKAFEILRRALDLAEAEAKEKYLSEARAAGSAAAADPLTLTPTKKKQPLAENMNLATSSPTSTVTSPKRAVPLSWSAWAARNLTVETAPRASIGHVNKVTTAAFGNGAHQRLRCLNLQQKAALCALVAYEKATRAAHAQMAAAQQQQQQQHQYHALPSPSKSLRAGASAAPTIKALYGTYTRMCKHDAMLHPLSSSEFREVVGSLETLSLVTAVDGRTGSFAALQATAAGGGSGGAGRVSGSGSGSGSGRRGRPGGLGVVGGGLGGGMADGKQVASCVGERELQAALDGPGADILRSILSGEALD